jgi:outer membrane protein OmpA-like peptidoglycan-associated protein
MNATRFIPATLITIALLAGCSSIPASNSTLEQARSDYRRAQDNPQVVSLAPGELKQAGESLDQANGAWNRGDSRDKVDHLAYVAKQQVAIAEQTASQKAAELAVSNASAERDRARLDARTREADSAEQRAENAKRSAENAQRSAEFAQRQAAGERQAANDANQNAQLARQQAQDAESRNQQLEAQLRDLEAKKTNRGMVITFGDVLFDTNQAQLKSGGMRNVQKLAEFFRQYPQRKVMIEGFTDSTGSDGRNQDLSNQRAGSVRTALLGMGVGDERIATRGYGEAFPVAGNDSAAGRQLNRRVEVIISDDSGNISPR